MNPSIIQLGGKSYIKSKVVMLPTENKAKKGDLFINGMYKLMVATSDKEIYNAQHLYFLSSEEIKEGDWMIEDISNNIYQCNRIENGIYITKYGTGSKFMKKIIATTDESLTETVEFEGTPFDITQPALPRPSNEFLQAYCKANGKIEEVLVEVEKLCFNDSDKSLLDEKGQVKLQYRLKLSPDNTITIKRVEEKVYSIDQVIKAMDFAHGEGIRFGYNTNYKSSLNDYGDWIRENLK